MPEFQFHHCAASVPDIDAAIAWYGRVLDFVIEKRFYIEPARAQAAMLRNGPLRIELFAPEAANALPDDRQYPALDILTHGNKHVAFRIASVDSFIEEMNEKDVEITLVIREKFGSGCFIRDCAGNLIEFVEEEDD